MSAPAVTEVLDFSQPVALMLVGILHFLEDKDHPERIVDTLLDALPPGSYLTASHLNPEHDPAGGAAGVSVRLLPQGGQRPVSDNLQVFHRRAGARERAFDLSSQGVGSLAGGRRV